VDVLVVCFPVDAAEFEDRATSIEKLALTTLRFSFEMEHCRFVSVSAVVFSACCTSR